MLLQLRKVPRCLATKCLVPKHLATKYLAPKYLLNTLNLAPIFIGIFSFASAAWGQESASKQPSLVEMFLPFIAIFAIFYFLIIRPQGKRQKAHQELVANVKKGDEILTASGILGKIQGVTEQYVTLEIADGVNIKLLRSQIASTTQEGQR